MNRDHVMWRCHWTIEKWDGDVDSTAARAEGITPVEVVEIPGNLALNSGITEALKLICGITATAYSSANAQLGVGTSTTAEVATQTNLQASGVWKSMNASYPSVSAQTATWQSDFGTADANQAWNEWGVRNGATALILLNRKVQALGTKPNTQTWTLSGSVTLS